MGSRKEKPLSVIVIAYGQRGRAYSAAAERLPDKVHLVGVADTSLQARERFAQDHGRHLKKDLVFTDWRECLQGTKKADAVIIGLQDKLHKDCAIAAANLGYHILCEKPLAVTLDDCREILQAVRKANVIFGIGHVLRYNAHNAFIYETLRSGRLGDILNINHTEPVGFWHFAHSFVRGNWGVEADSTFSLMAKCCHDVDILHSYIDHLPNGALTKVSSFGTLAHFRKGRKPQAAGNAIKCKTCAVNKSCSYSAEKIYVEPFNAGSYEFPLDILVPPNSTVQDLEKVLKETNYGSCVYELSNDVCDNQTVNIAFQSDAGPATATLTMVATSEEVCERQTRIYGSNGVLTSNSVDDIKIYDFTSRTESSHDVHAETRGGHGGGDFGLFKNWVDALAAVVHRGEKVVDAQKKYLYVSLDDILQSHRTVFCAETSRRQNGTPIDLTSLEWTLSVAFESRLSRTWFWTNQGNPPTQGFRYRYRPGIATDYVLVSIACILDYKHPMSRRELYTIIEIAETVDEPPCLAMQHTRLVLSASATASITELVENHQCLLPIDLPFQLRANLAIGWFEHSDLVRLDDAVRKAIQDGSDTLQRLNAQRFKLDELTRFSKLYVDESKRSPELHAIMADIQDSVERAEYDKLHGSRTAPESTKLLTNVQTDEWASAKKEIAAILNVVITMLAASAAAWWASGNVAPVKKLGYAFAASMTLGIVEIVLYAIYFNKAAYRQRRGRQAVKLQLPAPTPPSLRRSASVPRYPPALSTSPLSGQARPIESPVLDRLTLARRAALQNDLRKRAIEQHRQRRQNASSLDLTTRGLSITRMMRCNSM